MFGAIILGWDNYDEGGDLELQVERFRELYGCYPELLLADRKYLTRENRRYLKEHNIRIVGKPLGRPPRKRSYRDTGSIRPGKSRI